MFERQKSQSKETASMYIASSNICMPHCPFHLSSSLVTAFASVTKELSESEISRHLCFTIQMHFETSQVNFPGWEASEKPLGY